MKQRSTFNIDRQQGVALPIVMVILVLSAMIVLYMANTSKKEQQISADQYRTEQSFNAAMAGLDWAVDYYNENGLDRESVGETGYGVVDYAPPLDASGNPSDTDAEPCESNCASAVYGCPKRWCIGSDVSTDTSATDASGDLIVKSRTFFCKTDATFWSDPKNCSVAEIDDPENVGIVSIGYSDDNTARRVVSVKVKPLSPFPGGGPTSPMTSHGKVTSGGNFTIINRYYDYNVWVGEEFAYTPSSATESYVRDRDLSTILKIEGGCDSPDRFDPCNREFMISPNTANTGGVDRGALPASSSNRGNNADVVDFDPTLNKLKKLPFTPGEKCDPDSDYFFCAFFTTFSGPQGVWDAADGIQQAFEGSDACSEVISDPPLTGVIYLKGDCTLSKGSIGTFDEPVILFIDGDVEFKGGQGSDSTNVFGLVYVTGTMSITGSITIIGSALSEDGVLVSGGGGGGGGNGTFVFDLFSLTPTQGFNGLRGIVPNTWRDWKLN